MVLDKPAIKYGIKRNKVITVYGHKKQYKEKVGRHRSYTLWKTTRKNLPGKIYQGRFFNTKEQAMKAKNTRKKNIRPQRTRKVKKR